ncbi:YopX family protein [Bacillus halotolerans]|uniref:YopX family protein n=2 Tax=Bacillus halotolerans TaxID=260554 RepID=UPI001C005F1D|nr:YopX family protein [Bacillus halotolerans]
MNTEFRVWDGEQMHYRDDKGRSLTIDGDWVLRRQCNGVLVCVTDSSTAALMTETDQREKCNQENNVCG